MYGTCICLCLSGLYVVAQCSSPPNPRHVWPFTSESRGYDLIQRDDRNSMMFGNTYSADGKYFVLDGASFIELDIDGDMSNDFTIVVDIEIYSDGVLIQFVKKDFSEVMTLTRVNGVLYAKFENGNPSTQSASIPKGPAQLVIKRKDIKWTISSACEKINHDGIESPVKLRLGTSFVYKRYMKGKIGCFRLYSVYMDQGCIKETASDCNFEPGKLPADLKVSVLEEFNKGYFRLVSLGKIPACNDCVLLTSEVERTFQCGFMCLRQTFCVAFGVVRRANGLNKTCHLFPQLYSPKEPLENSGYYLATKLEK